MARGKASSRAHIGTADSTHEHERQIKSWTKKRKGTERAVLVLKNHLFFFRPFYAARAAGSSTNTTNYYSFIRTAENGCASNPISMSVCVCARMFCPEFYRNAFIQYEKEALDRYWGKEKNPLALFLLAIQTKEKSYSLAMDFLKLTSPPVPFDEKKIQFNPQSYSSWSVKQSDMDRKKNNVDPQFISFPLSFWKFLIL